MKIISVVLAILYCFNLSAQIKHAGVLSPQEVRDLVNQKGASSLFQYDRLAGSDTRFIIESPTLRTPQSDVLPASEWAFYSLDAGQYKQIPGGRITAQSNAILCWLGCNDSTATKQWSKRLMKQYGKLNTTQGELAVPARWVSDTLYVALFPTHQAGLWIASSSYPEWIVKSGISYPAPFEDNGEEASKPTLREWVMDLRPDLFQTLDGDGSNLWKIQQQELTLLAYEVNRNIGVTSSRSDDSSFMILVLETADGNLDIELLSPSPATSAQQTLVGELRTAFRKITTLHIPTRRLLQGKTLPGCLLNAKKEICWRFNSIIKL